MNIPQCPKCGSEMNLRKGKFGEFYGCSRYPDCNGKLSITQAEKARMCPSLFQEKVEQVAETKMERWNARLHGWRVWLIAGSILLSIMGMVGFAEFMYEEAIQQAGFGGFILKSAGLANEAFEQAERQEKMINSMSKFTHVFGWISPFNWHAYLMFIDGAQQNCEAIKLWAIARNPVLAESVMEAQVITVLDGDSIALSTGEEIRLAGIDAPEWYEEGGIEAKQMLTSLVLHKKVRIERLETGYYGRVIANLYLNGQDVGTLLCKAGVAQAVTPLKIHSMELYEGVITQIQGIKQLDGGFILLTGFPIDVFVLAAAAKELDLKALEGATIEALGKFKLYNGTPEIVVDDIANLRIIKGG